MGEIDGLVSPAEAERGGRRIYNHEDGAFEQRVCGMFTTLEAHKWRDRRKSLKGL
ncbi:MAG TPA: hypothetical protein VHT28_02910 [Silvibacterium sp.]|nr:hypothetical protein [Silvibacterium sp.]